MGIKQKQREILEATREFAETHGIHYDEFTQSMILNAMCEIANIMDNVCDVKVKENDKVISLPTEDEMYAELERKFDLGKHHEDGMQIDDTQIGWEKCYEWIVSRCKA